jgi:hypothetical protein
MAGGYYTGYIWKSSYKGKTFFIQAEITKVNTYQIEAFDQQHVALLSLQGDAIPPYLAANRNSGNTWHQWSNDSKLLRLPYPFLTWGKASFFGPKLMYIPVNNYNINGTYTGAILRVRNLFPEAIASNKKLLERKFGDFYPKPARKNIFWPR